MILEDWVAFPVGNRIGLFTAGFIKGDIRNVNSKNGNISGIDNILVVFDAGAGRRGKYKKPKNTKPFREFTKWLKKLPGSGLTRKSLLLLFISHFHTDHINLLPAVIDEWIQRVDAKSSKMLIVFPSGNFIEGSLWVARERVARVNYARVLIDAISSMEESEESSFNEKGASNLLDVIRFIYGDNSVLRKWGLNFNENNIYRIIVPSIPEEGFNYEGFYDLIIPETPNDGFPNNGWFRWGRRGNEGREGSEFGGFSISCDYCVSLKERDLANWFMHWNIGVKNAAVENTYVLLHKYKGNSPIPGIGIYANYSQGSELVHVFMPYFADEFHRDYYGCEDQIERIIKNGAWRNGFDKDVFEEVRKCVVRKIGSGRLNESSMVLFHAPSDVVRTSLLGWCLDWYLDWCIEWYLDWCIEWCCCEWCWDDCLLSGSHTLHLPFLSDARWYLMTGDQYMDKVVDIFDNRWKREKGKLSGHFNNEDFAWIQIPHHGSEGNWSRNNANKSWYSLPDGIHRKYFISGTTGSNVFSTIEDLLSNNKIVFWLR